MTPWSTTIERAVRELRLAAKIYESEGLRALSGSATEVANDLADVLHQWPGVAEKKEVDREGPVCTVEEREGPEGGRP